jgi:hypothetical protein
MLTQQMRLEPLVITCALLFVTEAAAQKWAPEQQTAPKTQPAPQQQKAPYAARRHDPQRERCDNFRRELRQVRQQERETTSTGARDHAGLRRQQILEQMERAGCN